MPEYTDKQLIEELKLRLGKNRSSEETLENIQRELKSVNRKLEESESMKSHFISNITNEIINPFSSILGLSKAILKVDKENWKKVVSMVAMIHSEAFALDFQLKNIFAAAKIEAGEIVPEIGKVDIFSLMSSVVNSFSIEAKKKKVAIDFNYRIQSRSERSKYFKTDAEKLRLIMANMINNAVKFSFEEGVVTVDVSKEGKFLVVSVIDNGTGISEENQEIIFDRFKRVDSGITSTLRGHGLGLSINKAMLDLLNGEINVSSQIGEGSEFTIRLPEHDDEATMTAYDSDEIFFDEKQMF